MPVTHVTTTTDNTNTSTCAATANPIATSRGCRITRATAMPVNPNPTNPVTFTMPAQLIKNPLAAINHTPWPTKSSRTRSAPRNPNSTPTSSNPNKIASLWIPPTKCRIVNGFSTPNHTAACGITPHRRANCTTAHPMSATHPNANSRCANTPATTLSFVTQLIAAAAPNATGPYGLGECAQINGTDRASRFSVPNKSIGPAEYGSNPCTTIDPFAKYE